MSSFLLMIALAVSNIGFGPHQAECSIEGTAPISAEQACEIFKDEFEQALQRNKGSENTYSENGREFAVELTGPKGPKISGSISWKVTGSPSAGTVRGEQVQNITMDKAIDSQSYRALIKELIRINWKDLSK